MTTLDSKRGKAVLITAHVAGMIDLVALPIWVGTLMQHYGFGPERAGLLLTLFLMSIVASSLVFAPRFNRLPQRQTAGAGFALAAMAFLAVASQPMSVASFVPLALLHAVAGLGVGCGLSFTHGAMGRSPNPHGYFALAGMVIGIFAVLFLGGTPVFLQGRSPTLLFLVFSLLMSIATVSVIFAFPTIEKAGGLAGSREDLRQRQPIGVSAWLAIVVVVSMTLNQTMIFAFLERMGASRGFSPEQVNRVLLTVGLTNLAPALLAALLQKRIGAQHVALMAPILQATLAWLITSSTTYIPYAVAASFYVSVMIFTHTFLFGLIARLDPSGRAVAATPAMIMFGSGMGPALGGVVVQVSGYAGLGQAVLVVGLVAMGSAFGVIKAVSRSGSENLPALLRQPIK